MATRILAIETSCDETSAAVVEDGRQVLSNIISSQIKTHQLFGGVVPEIASRQHMIHITGVVEEALRAAGVTWDDLDAVAVTKGPGLVGALLVGVSYAKGAALARKLPLVGVHHIEGHIYANFIEFPELAPPFLCLVVSGGHTNLVWLEDHGKLRVLGQTRDDAAGEAYDKIARALGLGYPGGPRIEALAREGNPEAIVFPRAQAGGDFSFSGLKSAVLNHLNRAAMRGEELVKADVAASFQKAVVDVLVDHTLSRAAELGARRVVLAGGVAANKALREALTREGEKAGLTVSYPSPVYCTDNAAMIGVAGYYRLLRGDVAGLDLNAHASLVLGS